MFILSVAYLKPENLNVYSVPVNDQYIQQEGPYSIVRHPIYSGLILLSFGFAMMSNSMERSILSILLFWILDNKANEEEKILSRKLGKVTTYTILSF